MKRTIAALVLVLAITPLCYATVAAAGEVAVAVTQVADLGDIPSVVRQIHDAATAGDWKLAVAFGLVGIIWALRTYGRKILPARAAQWFATDRGGLALAFITATLGGIVSGRVGGKPWTLSLIAQGATMAVTAVGGWHTIQSALHPGDGGKVLPVTTPPPVPKK